MVFRCIWHSLAQSKVIAFSWQLLHGNRSSVLKIREIVCFILRGWSLRLTLFCVVISLVAYGMTFLDGWESLSRAARSKKVRNGIMLIRHTMLWVI